MAGREHDVDDVGAESRARVSSTLATGSARALERLPELLARWRKAWPRALPLDALDDATLLAAVACFEQGLGQAGGALAGHLVEQATSGPVRSAGRMLRAWFADEPAARSLWDADGPRAMALMAEVHAGASLPAALLLRTALELRHRWAEGGAALSVSGSRDLASPVVALTLAGRLPDAAAIGAAGRLKPGVAIDLLVSALAEEQRTELALDVARAQTIGPRAASALAVALVRRGHDVETLARWNAPATELGALVLVHRLLETGRKGEARRLLSAWDHRVRDPESPALLIGRDRDVGTAAVRWAIELPGLPAAARAAVETLLGRIEEPLPDTGAASKLAIAVLAHLRGDLDVSVTLAEDAASRDSMYVGAARTLAWMGYPDRAAAVAESAPEPARTQCLRAAAVGHVAARDVDAAFALASRVAPPSSAIVLSAAVDAVAGQPEGRLGPIAWWPRRAATQA